jgi:hypothetical protein
MVDGSSPKKFIPPSQPMFINSASEQEERLVSILELVHIEKYAPKNITRFRYPGRKSLDRPALARAFVAIAYYRLALTSDLRRTLLSAVKKDSQYNRHREKAAGLNSYVSGPVRLTSTLSFPWQ